MKAIFVAITVFVVAIAVSWFGWWSAVSPAAMNRVPLWIVKGINLPVATVGWLSHSYQGIDFWYGSMGCDFCTPAQHRFHYFKFAVPVYVLLFSAPLLIQFWRKRRAA